MNLYCPKSTIVIDFYFLYLAVGGLPVFNVVVVKFYINCMVAINRCMIVLVLIPCSTGSPYLFRCGVNYLYLCRNDLRSE